MARIKIEITSDKQGEGKGVIADAIVSFMWDLAGVSSAFETEDEENSSHVVYAEFDVKEYFGKGE